MLKESSTCSISFIEVWRSLTDEVKEKHSEIPWHEMVGMRNVLTHEYFRVKPAVLFETVTTQFKSLECQLNELTAEYPM